MKSARPENIISLNSQVNCTLTSVEIVFIGISSILSFSIIFWLLESWIFDDVVIISEDLASLDGLKVK